MIIDESFEYTWKYNLQLVHLNWQNMKIKKHIWMVPMGPLDISTRMISMATQYESKKGFVNEHWIRDEWNDSTFCKVATVCDFYSHCKCSKFETDFRRIGLFCRFGIIEIRRLKPKNSQFD